MMDENTTITMSDEEIQATQEQSKEMEQQLDGNDSNNGIDDTTIDSIENEGGEVEQQGQGEPEADKDVQSEIDNSKEAMKEIEKDIVSKGLDFTALEAEYAEKGAFSDETYQALEKAGYPKAAIATYIAGLEATATKFEKTVFEYAGGQDAFTDMQKFVADQGEQAINAFNKTIEAGDLGQINLLVNGLKAQMQTAAGAKTADRRILGNKVSPTGNIAQGFTTQKSMIEAINDPRYGVNPSYTKQVQDKLLKTDL